MIYIFDIDGTLANIEHRLHFIQQEPKDWRGFFAGCHGDEPINDVIVTANLLHNAGAFLIAITGRSDEIFAETRDWLKRFVNIDHLYMRKAGDHRQDNIVKSELLDQLRFDYQNREIIGVFEDRQQVVDMYRAKGLRVFQVAEGKF